MSATQQLMQNMTSSLVCAGIDPDLSKIPQDMRKGTEVETIFNFLQQYIDIVSSNVCAFKAQKAFFDLHPDGHNLLKETIAYIHKNYPKIPVLLDCKIGDIDNTMKAYTVNVFDNLKADGVLVNPYMGDDVLKAFSERADKIIVVLAKTSNSGGSIIQDEILQNGKPLWLHVLDMAMNRWNENNNIVPVISAVNNPNQLKQARSIIPDTTPILFAGVGAQGRDISDIQLLLNSQKSGVFVNSSRGLMYPNTKEKMAWRIAVRKSVLQLQHDLNVLRQRSITKFLILGGVSGVGKTTVMQELKKLDKRFTYISPDITRPLRKDEHDKNYLPLDKMQKNCRQDAYLTVNEINGIYYATPKAPIIEAMKEGKFPMLDFPIDKTEIITNFCRKENVFTAYLIPPSVNVLKSRLQADNRDRDGKRFAKAQKEIMLYEQGAYEDKINMKIISETGKAKQIAKNIYDAFINSFKKQNSLFLATKRKDHEKQ